MTRLRPRRRDDGVTTVEFALVLPIFLAITIIGAFFAWYFYTQAQVDRAAQRAARFAAVPTTAGTWDFCQDAVLRLVNDDVLSSEVATSGLLVKDAKGTPASPGTGPCAQPRGSVKVTITHSFTNPFTPLLALVTTGSGRVTVSGSGQARVEVP